MYLAQFHKVCLNSTMREIYVPVFKIKFTKHQKDDDFMQSSVTKKKNKYKNKKLTTK